MGIFKMFTVDAEHIRAQAQIDAARIKQKASNDAARSVVESRKIVQNANNAASTEWAAAQRQVQAANNNAAKRMEGVATSMQKTRNDVASRERVERLKVQSAYNDQSIQVTEAKKTLIAARNERAASKSSLALFGASVQNQEIMRQAGDKINEVSEQLGASMAGATAGRAFERLANSELMGATIAQMAVAGVGSSMVESFNQAVDLRQALKEEQQDRELRARVHVANQMKGNVLREMSGRMGSYDGAVDLDRSILIADQDFSVVEDNTDVSPIFSNQDYSVINDVQDFEVYSPQIDYTVYEDHHKMGTFQKVATGVGAAVATYFGGPAAGQAVLNASASIYEARNGNFQGAAAYGNQAMQNATTGWQTWRAAGNNTQAGSSWGSEMLAKAGVNFKI